MREVYVIGAGMTRFGRAGDWSLIDILEYAAVQAMKDADLDVEIQSVFVANMGAGVLNRLSGVGSAMVDRLCLFPASAETVENGPASGGSAVKIGTMAVGSGAVDTALVIGGEVMRSVTGWEATDFVASLSHPQAEYIYGVTLPSLAGMFARLYMDRYGITPEHLAMVAIKNHENAMKNPNAHIQQTVSMEGLLHRPEAVVNNPYVAEPLRMFDCCPVSDGAAAVILCSKEIAEKSGKPMVRIAGFGQATDTHAMHERRDPTELAAVRLAAGQAFSMAGCEPGDVDVAELHDAFTILEIAESEEAGFFKKGTGHIALEMGETKPGGRIPINVSGGLKARGHPVGATGVAQVVEIAWQLAGKAGQRQLENARIGFTCNFGGFGNNVLCFVLARED